MSLESLLNNDSVTVAYKAAPSRDNSGGQASGGWTTLHSDVPARVEGAGAHTIQAFGQRGMDVTHTVYTQQSGIGVGMRITTSDGRYLIVDGVQDSKAIGGMPTYYTVTCHEYRPAG